MASRDPPLDEIQWRSPQTVEEMNGIHSNTVLHYFSRSPFFEDTSNNAVLTNQAFHNAHMYHLIQTREAFEGRLRTMAGLEFVVAQEPAEMGPGMGTGVWVIRKQTRRKLPGEADEITVHATYFVVGDNIYQAPTFADIMASRIEIVAAAMRRALPAAEAARTWNPSLGTIYQQPASTATANRLKDGADAAEDAGPTDGSAKRAGTSRNVLGSSLERLAEESFAVQLKHGGDYIDENAITGRPGDFHFASTGRKEKVLGLAKAPSDVTSVGAATPAGKDDAKKGTKVDKSPKTTANAPPKPRRRKSKMSQAAGAS